MEAKEDIPTIFVIFGITGDLARRKLIPSLLDLFAKDRLPKKCAVVGFSRRELSDENFLKILRDSIEYAGRGYKKDVVKKFLDIVSYHQGFFDNQESYQSLEGYLLKIDRKFGQCSNKLLYLAVPPSQYEVIFQHLGGSKLGLSCDDNTGWTRILVEKPFGKDLQTAKKLDKMLGKIFQERQIFRIDHYLAKEMMQNILVFRFSNPIFQPIWNRKFIEAVRIKFYEKSSVEGRAAFYEGLGALRDVGQNHILQMLALVAMEKPNLSDGNSIRARRAAVLSKLQPISKKDMPLRVLRAQYAGFSDLPGIPKDSQTETYFKIEARLSNHRWRDVPFFLESGKALSESLVEISVHFKPALFGGKKEDDFCNVLTFEIQPKSSIKIAFWAKKPGFAEDVEMRELSFSYRSDFSAPDVNVRERAVLDELPDAYEKVLYDCVRGDQTLFTSTRETSASWKFITSILENWQTRPLMRYKQGSKPELIRRQP
ncbi:MAG: glucose-6-phosphate dehydrogenase [bacterium]|nr:glucose-6-phosphate dehydrogenase [bacterium]